MEYKWICQDEDGDICKYKEEPCHSKSGGNWWHKKCEKYMTKYDEIKKPNRNWKSSLINLETHDYKIEDGILKRVKKITQRCKYADVFIEAANDRTKVLQVKKGETWQDVPVGMHEYRIKPENKVVRFRNYLATNGDVLSTTGDEMICGFVKWIGDWQDVEI